VIHFSQYETARGHCSMADHLRLPCPMGTANWKFRAERTSRVQRISRSRKRGKSELGHYPALRSDLCPVIVGRCGRVVMNSPASVRLRAANGKRSTRGLTPIWMNCSDTSRREKRIRSHLAQGRFTAPTRILCRVPRIPRLM
jgi:hypothetical protein